ncbi:hypothetical protein HHI36_009807 [Cryptolaemus montrouzieri]|uniref:Uncharacterized protein n=1 Tax=Cryptolaemus montrouzieri TaxID=559131 RepID=A0ABD2MGU8_9CUCU
MLSSNVQTKQEKSSPIKTTNQQVVTQQMLQMAGNQKQTIQIIQKQNSEEGDKKIKVSVTSQPQNLQNVTPQQLQNVKNVTLLRNSSPVQAPVLSTSSTKTGELQSVTVTVSKPVSMSEQMVQPGIQIKTPNNLTPAQQQQILQTIKQKILPQTVLASQQQQLLLKQKMAQVQKQTQAPGISLLGQGNKLNTECGVSKAGIVSTQAPVVAKVLTNAAGQVISVESLLAHQKQHGSLPQGTTLRVSGTKGGQPNIIHLTGATRQNTIAQFAVASQNNLIALTTQSKLVVATPTTSTVTSTITSSNKPTNRDRITNRTQQLTKLPSKVTQQLINAKIVQNIDGQKVVQPKLIVGQGSQMKLTASAGKNVALQKPTLSIAANANSIRMVNTANLNLTHIGGKPVLLASKGATLQNIQGQNVILQAQPGSSGPSLVLQNSKSLQSGNVPQSTSNINIINQQNVVLGPQVKMQQPQVVFKNNAINQVSQGHIVLGGQPVRLHTSTTPTTQRLVLASQGQGGQIVAQQILLPAGFQGTAINIKALQGVKVIPIAQAHGQNRGIQSRQLFARVVNPSLTAKAQQNTNVSEKIEEASPRDDA